MHSISNGGGASATLLGYALSTNSNRLYMMDATGTTSNLKGLWASFIEGGVSLDTGKWRKDFYQGASPAWQKWTRFTDSHYAEVVVWSRDSKVILIADPGAINADPSERNVMLAERMPIAHGRLVEILNAETEIPVSKLWGEKIWDKMIEGSRWMVKGVTTLDVYGSCLGAWIFNEEYDWESLIVSMVKRGELK